MTRSSKRGRRLFGLVLCALLTGFTAPGGGIGGTGQPRGGIGGTGVTAIGVIQRFGSIFVNGTEYHLLPATRYRIDGRPAVRRALRRGDTVFVEGHIRPRRATAASVRVQHALIGIIEASSRHARTLQILGQKVHLTADTLVRPATGDLKVGMDVAVSALARAPGIWQATRVHVFTPRPRAVAQPFLIRGPLQDLTSTSARIGGVRYRLADTHGRPAIGHDVVARGWYREGHPVITAIRGATTLADARGARILVAGYFHGKTMAWRYEDSTLRARTPLPPPTSRPAFIVALRTAPDHFVITKVMTPIHVMTFGLPSAVIGPTAAVHPTITRPAGLSGMAPSLVSPPAIMRPPVAMTRPAMPMMSRP